MRIGCNQDPSDLAVAPRNRVAAIAGIELRPNLPIWHLHVLQDRFGCLQQGHLLALAALLRLTPVEVVTFCCRASRKPTGRPSG